VLMVRTEGRATRSGPEKERGAIGTAFRIATVMAGEQFAPVVDAVLFIEDGRILSVALDTSGTPAEAGLGEVTLMHEFMDVHVSPFSYSDRRPGARIGIFRILLQTLSNAHCFPCSGVPTVRDVGCVGTLAMESCDAIDDGHPLGAGKVRVSRLVSKDRSYRKMIKSSGGKWESGGAVVLLIAVRNAAEATDRDFGHADHGANSCEDVDGIEWSNQPRRRCLRSKRDSPMISYRPRPGCRLWPDILFLNPRVLNSRLVTVARVCNEAA